VHRIGNERYKEGGRGNGKIRTDVKFKGDGMLLAGQKKV
jgi:hypothetical protein